MAQSIVCDSVWGSITAEGIDWELAGSLMRRHSIEATTSETAKRGRIGPATEPAKEEAVAEWREEQSSGKEIGVADRNVQKRGTQRGITAAGYETEPAFHPSGRR